jgi:hypothetical protein
MLENTEGAINNGHSIGYTRHRTKTNKTKHNTICVGNHYTRTNTTNVNKTWALLQTTEGKDEPNIVLRICSNDAYTTTRK